MEILLFVWEYFVNNFLTQPAYFIGLLVVVGYLLLKKPIYEVLAGFIKAVVGYMILSVGSGGLSSTFKPILAALQDRFNLSAIVLDTYMGQAAAQSAIESVGKSFSQVMILLLIAFVFNILLVKFQKITKLRAVFTTGHVQTQQATIAFWFILICFPQLGDMPLLFIMSVLLGLYWAVGSNLTVELAQELTDGAGFCVAHQQMFGIAIWSALGSKIFGTAVEGTKRFEDYELPGFLEIFNDNIVSTAILMTIFFAAILLVLGKEYLIEAGMLGATSSFLFYIMTTSFNFAVYLAILQLGVRTFVAELTNSFQGISDKLLPGAMPGIDCAAAYGFGSANAVTMGFMCGAAGQFLAIIALIVMQAPVLAVAGFVPVFFDNATIAVYVNS
ncbi:MAG: PTS ascorbate transporter subunit IIC, partial [Erysipelotrichaceae bacterium]